jgi:signal transduction histidine kinase
MKVNLDFRTWKLGTKLAATFSTVIVLVVALVSLAVVSRSRHALEQELRERGADAVQNLSRLSAELVLDEDLWGLYKVVRDLVVGGGETDNLVAYAAVVDAQGRVLAHSSPAHHPIGTPLGEEVGADAQAYRAGTHWSSRSGAAGEVHHFAAPVVVDGQQIATARIGISLRRLEPTISRMRLEILALALLLALLGAWLGHQISRRMTRPLTELGRAVDLIAAGKLEGSPAVSTREKDEIGALADRFNLMAGRLRDSRRDAEEAQARLVRSERLASVGEYAGSLAHEIRNPLGAVVAAARMLSSRTPQAASYDRERLAAVIAEEARRLSRILSDFLAFARTRPPVLQRHSMNAVVAEVVESLRLDDLAAGKVLDLRPGPEEAACDMDRDQVKQVLWNLLRNALEATPERGRVVVATRQRDGAATVEIADEGPGIPPDREAHLFEPFHSTKKGGSGLGLAIAHRLVTGHHGIITVSSRPGQGTRIGVSLPLRGVPEPAPASEGA